MRRRVDGSWVDEQLPRDYWEKLDRKRAMQLRGDVEQGMVELDASEQVELAKLEAKFAQKSERARWKGLGPSSREGEYQFAKRRHEQDRKALKKAVEEAAAQNDDERLRNSARRILDGGSLLYALTPTPDSAARALAAGKPGMRALFGYPDSDPFHTRRVRGHVLDDQAADYDASDLTNNSRVLFVSPDSGGFRTLAGGKIFVVEPSRTDAINARRRELGIPGRFDPVQEVLKHESQHEVDRIHQQDLKRIARWRKSTDPEKRNAAIALAEYQTEFRAYAAQQPGWLRTPLTRREQDTLERLSLSFPRAEQPGPGTAPETSGFTDWVQLKIFLHIYMHYPNVKKEWDKATLARKAPGATTEESRWFRDAVLRTRGGLDHVSANPTNSPRIERFWPALHKANKRDAPDLESDAMADLVIALQTLDDNDRAVLQRNAYYQRLEIREWLRETVDAFLRDPRADVTPILGAEQAKRAESRRQQEEQMRRVKRAKPPRAEDLQAAEITSWEDMDALLKTVTTNDNTPSLEDPRVTEQLQDLHTWYPQPSPQELASFVLQVSPFVDLWPALDARRAQ